MIKSSKVLRLTDTATLPLRKSQFAAGFDLFSDEAAIIAPRGKGLIATGLSIGTCYRCKLTACPPGTYGRIAPRSGIAWNHHISVGAGVIDADFRGHVRVLLFNHHGEDAFRIKYDFSNSFLISAGDRIAQLILERYAPATIVEVEMLATTKRGKYYSHRNRCKWIRQHREMNVSPPRLCLLTADSPSRNFYLLSVQILYPEQIQNVGYDPPIQRREIAKRNGKHRIPLQRRSVDA